MSLLLSVSACSSSTIKKTRATDQTITEINLLAVHFFRPAYPVAELEDFSQHDRKLRCETPSTLWSEYLQPGPTKALIECLNSLNETADYLYLPKAQPLLEVDALKKGPDLCLYRLLPTLPLPREIYFLGQTQWNAGQETFAMSFDTKANQAADIEFRVPRFEVKFKFPLIRRLENAQDLNLWLITSVLSLFEQKGQINASIVPTALADACFQDDPLFSDKRSGKIPGVFWP